MVAYAELAVTTNFSFLRGASNPEELVAQAKELGLAGLGVADRNTVAGVVRVHIAAREAGLKIVVGARLAFADGTPDILAYPQDRPAWGRLTQLLTRGKLRADKGDCILSVDDLFDYIEGLNLIVIPPRRIDAGALTILFARLKKVAARGSVWLAATVLYRGDDNRRLARLAEISRDAFIPLIAVNDVLYHAPARRPLQDVITCIREHETIDTAGRQLEVNAERHLKGSAEMARLFSAMPPAIEQTLRFFDRCGFSLDELKKTEYPDESRQGFASPQKALVALAEEGARRRFPNGLTQKIRDSLEKELAVTAELKYAPYFLTVYDIVQFARSKGILCQGRGSAANSVICYCLHITDVNPERIDLLFERFVSAERREPPDIDVDFEHERREEVIQYIYEKYGRDHAGLAATVICYRGRSAIRDVGKAFGLSEDAISALASMLWGWSMEGVDEQDAGRAGLDPADPRLKQVLDLAKTLIGFPRHLSQHVGGFVITRSPLDAVVPIENAAMEDRTVIEWNKDDLNDLDILKVDVLGLGMLSCLRRSFDLLKTHYGVERDLLIQDEEEPVYRMIQCADTIGVFQIESRAQMSMLPRLRPKEFYDLVIEVAIVRPGPIQGDMVHPYLRRRQGLEPITYPSPELETILRKTLGVPLFQEHAMRIAIVAAGFAPAEADRLRRAMATFKRVGTIETFCDKFIKGMVERKYPREFAERCFQQIEGFGEYGFPESHAASFANLVYASAWIKCRYPDVFVCALLNSQPMGFYASAQLVRDAEEHGVEIRSVDINFSTWDNSLEPSALKLKRLKLRHASMQDDIRTGHAVRLGFRKISGFKEDDGKLIEKVRGAGFDSIRDLWLRTGLHPATLERLAKADAFGSLGLKRREALWVVRALRRAGDKDDLPLLARVATPALEPDVALPPMRLGEEVVEDYRFLELSLKAHPVSFLRAELERRGILRHENLAAIPSGRRVTVAGLVLVRQRPGSANGVIFMTLEDETGIANTIVWPQVYEAFRPVVLGARLVSVTGRLQNEFGVIHVIVDEVEDLTPLLRRLSDDTYEVSQPLSEQSKLLKKPWTGMATTEAVMPKGRNFH